MKKAIFVKLIFFILPATVGSLGDDFRKICLFFY